MPEDEPTELVAIPRAEVRLAFHPEDGPSKVILHDERAWEVVREDADNYWCRPYDGPLMTWAFINA